MIYKYYGDELYHHGILGMKWGVRRYQNKDGTLTAEGKRHVKTYQTSEELRKKTFDESDKLIKSDKRLGDDFGTSADDTTFVEIIANEYGIDTTALTDANLAFYSYTRANSDSIRIGRKITQKLLK